MILVVIYHSGKSSLLPDSMRKFRHNRLSCGLTRVGRRTLADVPSSILSQPKNVTPNMHFSWDMTLAFMTASTTLGGGGVRGREEGGGRFEEEKL